MMIKSHPYLVDNFLFNCNSRSCLKDDGLNDVIKNSLTKDIDLDDVRLFGLKINLDKVNLNTIQHLFASLRKYSDYLRNSSLTNEFISSRNKVKVNWHFLREEVVRTLSLFKFLLNKSTCSIELKKLILNELKNLLLSINRLSHLPELIFYELFSSTSNKSGPTNQLFHLYLDIWWNVYQIFKHINDSVLKDDIFLIRDQLFSGDLINQFRNIFLADLITISLIKFNINHLDNNYRPLDAFSCSCIKLIYVLIYLDYEVEQQEDTSITNSFWNNFNKILDVIFAQQTPSQVESVKHFQWINSTKSNLNKNGQFTSLWLISNLADLFHSVDTDQFCELDQLKKFSQFEFQDNNLYVSNVIKTLIKFEDREVNVVQLLNILKLCFKLSKNWNLSIEIVLLFFDFFMKNLNAPLQLNTNIKNMQMLPKSGFIWYQRLNHLDNVALTSLDNEENVNQLIYFLIYSFVKRSVDDHSASNHFQKFKGRLYSKLQTKKIEEFNEIGLYNLLNTFLVTSFASKNNSLDLINKFLFVIKIVKNKSLYNSKMILVFKSLFSFNYFLTKDQDLVRLNEIIVDLFNEICESIPNWSLNNMQLSTVHNSYFELVNIFCNELLDYLKNERTPNQSFGNLFKCKFILLLNKLSEREVLSILQFLNNLIDEIKLKIENDEYNSDLSFYSSIFELLNEQFIDFLRLQMQSKSNNPQISIIVYEFIYTTVLLSTNEQNFKSLIDNFLFNKSSSMFNLSELMVRIVDSDMVFSKLLDAYYGCNLDKKLMELWFQIAITSQLPAERFDKLTRQLSVRFSAFKSTNTGLQSVQDVFLNLSLKYKSLSTSQEKAKFSLELNQCLAETINQGKLIVKDENINEEKLNQMYLFLSYLVVNCSPIIYVIGNNNSILPQILETFFNPNFIDTLPKVKAQSVNGCIRKTIAKILIGVSQLNRTNDPYIDRKLKVMFTNYIPKFLIKNSTHPILLEFSQNRNNELFFLTLHYVKDYLFINKLAPNPAITIQMIQFLTEFYLFFRNQTEPRNQMLKLFPHFLDKLLTSDELTKRKIRDLLVLMVNNSKEQLGEDNLKVQLTEYYEEFINKNSENLNRVIRILEFTLSFCVLIKEKIGSILMHLIKEKESKPSGVDELLRNCFREFVNKISS